MITRLSGTVKDRTEQTITLQVGPVGLGIFVPDSLSFQIEKEAELYTHMHWSAENGPSFFGFSSTLERTVFVSIIGCSGVGPKLALAVLADLGAPGFLEAIQTGDERMLSKVSGIGAKKAEQIIVQLKHKVARLIDQGDIKIESGTQLADWQTVTQALSSLNYSRTEVTRAMNHLKGAYGGTQLSFDQLMRHALSFLSKQQ